MRNFFKALFFGRESDSCAFMLRWKTLNSSARNEEGGRGVEKEAYILHLLVQIELGIHETSLYIY